MDQKNVGSFLRELRKEKQLTQEQLAERFGVTNRSVSRWETGSNMPDLSILVELADFYDVDIRDIIDGERKGSFVMPSHDVTLRYNALCEEHSYDNGFCTKCGGYQPAGRPEPSNAGAEGFMSIPEGIEDDLPFK